MSLCEIDQEKLTPNPTPHSQNGHAKANAVPRGSAPLEGCSGLTVLLVGVGSAGEGMDEV